MHLHRQLHVWISESDYRLLRERSVEEQESVSAILRRLIKTERLRLRDDRPSPGDRQPGPELGALQ